MKYALTLVFILLNITWLSAQQKKFATPQKPEPVLDAEIRALIKDISEDSIRSYVYKMVSFGTRHSLSDTVSATQGIGAARRWVASKFRDFAKRAQVNMKVELDPFEVKPGPRNARVPYPVTMKNVVATLSGTDPNDNRVLLVSGHLDSRASDVMDSVIAAPGANDDASGVAVVLELARVMSKRRLPCTIIFMAVQGEEQGLLGARHMAGKMKEKGINLIAMLNNDIVGNSLASETGDKNNKTVRIFSEMIPALETDAQTQARNALKSENDSPSRQLARYIKEVSEPYLQGKFTATLNMRPDRFLRGGDHTPFCQLGFTAIRFCEFNENFNRQHQNIRTENGVDYGDLPEHVDYAYAANVARMNLITLASLAKAPGEPANVKMKINLDNMTHLTWDAPATGKVKGYYVLIRETYQPFWEKKIFVTDVKASLPYSKDNYFFAVQAVGENGHVSPIIMPMPSRN
jgi:Zn-dependent M28 family amino/carboxypeptidase